MGVRDAKNNRYTYPQSTAMVRTTTSSAIGSVKKAKNEDAIAIAKGKKLNSKYGILKEQIERAKKDDLRYVGNRLLKSGANFMANITALPKLMTQVKLEAAEKIENGLDKVLKAKKDSFFGKTLGTVIDSTVGLMKGAVAYKKKELAIKNKAYTKINDFFIEKEKKLNESAKEMKPSVLGKGLGFVAENAVDIGLLAMSGGTLNTVVSGASAIGNYARKAEADGAGAAEALGAGVFKGMSDILISKGSIKKLTSKIKVKMPPKVLNKMYQFKSKLFKQTSGATMAFMSKSGKSALNIGKKSISKLSSKIKRKIPFKLLNKLTQLKSNMLEGTGKVAKAIGNRPSKMIKTTIGLIKKQKERIRKGIVYTIDPVERAIDQVKNIAYGIYNKRYVDEEMPWIGDGGVISAEGMVDTLMLGLGNNMIKNGVVGAKKIPWKLAAGINDFKMKGKTYNRQKQNLTSRRNKGMHSTKQGKKINNKKKQNRSEKYKQGKAKLEQKYQAKKHKYKSKIEDIELNYKSAYFAQKAYSAQDEDDSSSQQSKVSLSKDKQDEKDSQLANKILKKIVRSLKDGELKEAFVKILDSRPTNVTIKTQEPDINKITGNLMSYLEPALMNM